MAINLTREDIYDVYNYLSIPNHEIMGWDPDKREDYYASLRSILANNDSVVSHKTMMQNIMGLLKTHLKRYGYEISGLENLPMDGSILAFNHSTDIDAIVLIEALGSTGYPVFPIVNKGTLSKYTVKGANLTEIDWNSQESKNLAVADVASKVLQNPQSFVAIAPEAVKNFLPHYPEYAMRGWHPEVVKLAKIAGKPIVPVVIEYIEHPEIVYRYKDLYTKCVVRFGKPVYISINDDNDMVLNNERSKLAEMRKSVWDEEGVTGEKNDVYLNHTGLKLGYGTMFKSTNSEFWRESSNINKIGDPKVDYYCLNPNEIGDLKPGPIDYYLWHRYTYGLPRSRKKMTFYYF